MTPFIIIVQFFLVFGIGFCLGNLNQLQLTKKALDGWKREIELRKALTNI